MSFQDFAEQHQAVALFQRSIARGRLAHGYLFSGNRLDTLEGVARTLAKVLNCQHPKRAEGSGAAVDCCDACSPCRRIEAETHPDVHWVRPESKSRLIRVEQMRELMQEINLKPTEAAWKVAVISAADRLNEQAANAFLKTLEEPPPRSVLVLLTNEPQRILETLQSRCLRLSFAGDAVAGIEPAQRDWLRRFAEAAAGQAAGLLGRYRLLGVMMRQLEETRAEIETALTAKSPLERYDDVEKELREKWEEELKASIEAEYRRRRAELLGLVQLWLRDIWLQTLAAGGDWLSFPDEASTAVLARRISPAQAQENLAVVEQTQRLLFTNVQEALALEVGLLKLQL